MIKLLEKPLVAVRTWIEALPVEGVVVLGVGVREPRRDEFQHAQCGAERVLGRVFVGGVFLVSSITLAFLPPRDAI